MRFPPEAARKPALIRPRVDPLAAPAELDRQVGELVARGESIYAVDADQLEWLAHDLIVTQDLCHVCAASPEDLASALARLPRERAPRVVTFTPRTLAEVWQGIRDIGEAAGHAAQAQALAERLARRVSAIENAMADATERPRVLCLEWFDPPYFGGHWVPEMVRLAGGIDALGHEGEPSVAVEWQDIFRAQPEVIVLMPCGYNLARTIEVWRSTRPPQGWEDLPAVKASRVYAVDGNSYFSRSGPRLVDGLALLARLLHPDRVVRGITPLPGAEEEGRYC